ncbi:MAG: YbhB/YbcL family Raf kinase inhibitor-like protein [Bacteriovorax sp.]|nr:YbhB/YbcL family Raf kinase inhibitor-like protein [Bacteriovorax sp.]
MLKIFFLILFTSVISIPSFGFELSSPDIKDGARLTDQQVFNGFGCFGKNISPLLQWKNPPIGTKSFAVTVYDPDAPTGSGWWHWTVFNIPSSVTQLEQGSGSNSKKLPLNAIEGRTDFGKPGFGGACPPVGDKPHRYIFTLYALKIEKLDLTSEASGALVGFYLGQNTIAKSTLTAKFGREK